MNSCSCISQPSRKVLNKKQDDSWCRNTENTLSFSSVYSIVYWKIQPRAHRLSVGRSRRICNANWRAANPPRNLLDLLDKHHVENRKSLIKPRNILGTGANLKSHFVRVVLRRIPWIGARGAKFYRRPGGRFYHKVDIITDTRESGAAVTSLIFRSARRKSLLRVGMACCECPFSTVTTAALSQWDLDLHHGSSRHLCVSCKWSASAGKNCGLHATNTRKCLSASRSHDWLWSICTEWHRRRTEFDAVSSCPFDPVRYPHSVDLKPFVLLGPFLFFSVSCE